MTDSSDRRRKPDRHSIGNRKLHPATQMMGYGFDPLLSEGALKPPIFLTSEANAAATSFTVPTGSEVALRVTGGAGDEGVAEPPVGRRLHLAENHATRRSALRSRAIQARA